MRRKCGLISLLVILAIISTACSDYKKEEMNIINTGINKEKEAMNEGNKSKDGAYMKLPQVLVEVPLNYRRVAENQGILVDLYYYTYESMSYEQHDKVLTKHAVIYLPYGYNNDETYNVFYLMHGGWSNETTYLGVANQPSEFKNILDHGMQDGVIKPMIIVCPTYNNESSSDSGDYGLALELTNNYHNELINDLIPAVEGTYHTFAQTTDRDGLLESRNHRAFCGFSMGSVATWRIFEYCLDYFRYFMPSSGSITNNGEYMASIVRDSGYEWDDLFIFAAFGYR